MTSPEPTEPAPVSDVLRTIADLSSPLERSAVLGQVGRVAAESIGAELGFLGLFDGPDQLQLTNVHGGATNALETIRVERGRGLGGKVLTLGEPAWVDDYTNADTITHEYDTEIAEEGLRGVLCLPLVVSDSLLGVAYVSDRIPTTYSDVMVDRVMTAVESAKIALHMADRSKELTEAAVEVERQRTVEVLDASVRTHLESILATAQSIARDPESPAALVAQANSIISTAGMASSLFDDSANGLLAASVPSPRSIEHRSKQYGLTPRELEVIQAASRGLSNPEIGEELFLARGTVKAYMQDALAKLQARNRVEAVMIASRAGLLDEI